MSRIWYPRVLALRPIAYTIHLIFCWTISVPISVAMVFVDSDAVGKLVIWTCALPFVLIGLIPLATTTLFLFEDRVTRFAGAPRTVLFEAIDELMVQPSGSSEVLVARLRSGGEPVLLERIYYPTFGDTERLGAKLRSHRYTIQDAVKAANDGRQRPNKQDQL